MIKVRNVSGVTREIAHRDVPPTPVAPGEDVEVPSHVAESLCKQTANWRPTPTTKARKGQSVKEND